MKGVVSNVGFNIMEVISGLSKNQSNGRLEAKVVLEWVEKWMGDSDYIKLFQKT